MSLAVPVKLKPVAPSLWKIPTWHNATIALSKTTRITTQKYGFILHAVLIQIKTLVMVLATRSDIVTTVMTVNSIKQWGIVRSILVRPSIQSPDFHHKHQGRLLQRNHSHYFNKWSIDLTWSRRYTIGMEINALLSFSIWYTGTHIPPENYLLTYCILYLIR